MLKLKSFAPLRKNAVNQLLFFFLFAFSPSACDVPACGYCFRHEKETKENENLVAAAVPS